jgi:hypothetical protein
MVRPCGHFRGLCGSLVVEWRWEEGRGHERICWNILRKEIVKDDVDGDVDWGEGRKERMRRFLERLVDPWEDFDVLGETMDEEKGNERLYRVD